METYTFVNRIYWSELQRNLNQFIDDLNKNTTWSEEKKSKLLQTVIDFCVQGTGFQKCLYRFVSDQFNRKSLQQKTTKKTYDVFVGEITEICIYLDQFYLNKYPKKKKTLKSIKDIAEWYWVGN